MLESTVPVVLLGRFSTFAGGGTFTTLPVNVVACETAMIHVWRGRIGPTSTFAFALEESNDGTVWTVLTSGDPGTETEVLMTATLTKAYVRAAVTLTDPTEVPVATCYAVGELLLRRAAMAGGAGRGPTGASGEVRPQGS
jgi:hypothetical protein